MPYKIKKVKGGYKVCKKDDSKCFSNDPMSKEDAEDQMRAMYANESIDPLKREFDRLFNEALEYLQENYDNLNFEDYFKFDGMQDLDLKGEKKIPIFTLKQPLEGLQKHSTYMASTLKEMGINVPYKYFSGIVKEDQLPSVFDILSNAPIDTPTKELKDIELEPYTLTDNEGNEIETMALKSIVVRPEFRGQSLFSKILDQLEKIYPNVLLYDVIHSKIKMAAQMRDYELIEGEDEGGTRTYHYLKNA